MASGDTDWNLLVRRAMSIPDVIGDAVATRAMERELHAFNSLPRIDQPEEPTMESKVLEAIVWAGDQGYLDEYLVDMDDAGVAKAEIQKRVREQTSWRTEALFHGIDSITVGALELIHALLKKYPFGDPGGSTVAPAP